MKATGWNNGKFHKSGAGYGIKINKNDRDRYFGRGWDSVVINIEGYGEIKVNISSSFWRGCSELRNIGIGRYMIEKGLTPWKKDNPPKFELVPIGERRFKLIPL